VPRNGKSTRMILAGVLAVGWAAGDALGQASMSPRARVQGGSGGSVVVIPNDPLLDPDSPESRRYAAMKRRERALERELRLIQRRHFGSVRGLERREIGIGKLREYTEPAALVLMTELFDDEDRDVRGMILDHFSSLESEEGDAALAWEAVHGEDRWYRERAAGHLAMRIAHTQPGEEGGVVVFGEAPPRARGVITHALTGEDDDAAVAAGHLVRTLGLYEYIPMMAAAQVATRGGGQERTGDLGWIMIGRQQSFTADLVPVVSNNAVGLDPQIGVVSDGVMLGRRNDPDPRRGGHGLPHRDLPHAGRLDDRGVGPAHRRAGLRRGEVARVVRDRVRAFSHGAGRRLTRAPVRIRGRSPHRCRFTPPRSQTRRRASPCA